MLVLFGTSDGDTRDPARRAHLSRLGADLRTRRNGAATPDLDYGVLLALDFEA